MSVEKVKRLKNLNEFCNYFNTDEKCRKFLVDVRWNGQPKCPDCGSRATGPDAERRFRCIRCPGRRKFSAIQRTIFENTSVSLPNWFTAIYLVKSENMLTASIERLCGVSHSTAWFMYQRILQMSQIDFDCFEKLFYSVFKLIPYISKRIR